MNRERQFVEGNTYFKKIVDARCSLHFKSLLWEMGEEKINWKNRRRRIGSAKSDLAGEEEEEAGWNWNCVAATETE